MNTAALTSYLINGGLLTILKAGQDQTAKAWIIADSTVPSGFRAAFEPSGGAGTGGKDIPAHSLQGEIIFGTKEGEVIDYLVDSFGLSRSQAERVAVEAHS